MKRIKVNLDKRSALFYEIIVGKDIMDRAALIIMRSNWAEKYIIITDSNVFDIYGGKILDFFRKGGLNVDMLAFPAGEASKTIQTALKLSEKLLDIGADRNTGLIALGGGVVGDMTGFVASIFMRGIPYIQIPTTLLAQVDSSIGGKTGVDLPSAKNMLGTFYQPRVVFADLAFLHTLSEREFKNGLAEIIKCGMIDDPELLRIVRDNKKSLSTMDMDETDFLTQIIMKSCRVKKGIVEMDERENGLRRILNFGHTIGHAVEAESNYSVSHGEAVSIGMIGALTLSEKLGYLTADERDRLSGIIQKTGLPCRVPANLDTDSIIARLRKDKKRGGGSIHFVLLKRAGMPFVNGGVPENLIRETIEGMKQ
jgi:3-dehydroquinate synthase